MKLDPVAAQLFAPVTPEAQSTTTLSDQLGAAFGMENLAVNVYNATQREDTGPFNPNYDPLDDVTDEELLEIGGDRLARVKNADDLAALRTQRTWEQNARKAIDDGPMPGLLATLIAGVADPTSYVPLLGGLTTAARGARVGVRIGAAALATGGEVAASELALQGLQETRTASESLAAVLTGAALGGTLAAGGEALGRMLARQNVDDVLALAQQATSPTGSPVIPGGSVGAMFAPVPKNDADLAVVFEDALEPLARGLNKARLSAPGLRLAVSPLRSLRRFAHGLVDMGFVTKGEVAGRPVTDFAAVDVRLRMHDSVKHQASGAIHGGYRAARKTGFTGSRVDFNRGVGEALLDPNLQVHPEVRATATALKEKVIRPYYDKLVEAGIFEARAGADPIESYLHRIWDTPAVRRDPEGVKAVLAQHFQTKMEHEQRVGNEIMDARQRIAQVDEQIAEFEAKRKLAEDEVATMARGGQAKGQNAGRAKAAQQRVDNIDNAIAKLKQDQVKIKDTLRASVKAQTGMDTTNPIWFDRWNANQREIVNAEGAENFAAQAAQDVWEQLAGFNQGPQQVLSGITVKAQGPLKGRQLDIPSALVKSWINMDADAAMSRYIDMAGNDLETYKAFGTFDIEEMLKPAKEELAEQLAKIKAEAKTPEEAARKSEELNKRALDEFQQARGLFNRVRGFKRPLSEMEVGPRNVAAGARTLNFMRSLGSVVVSSLPDTGRLVLQEGLGRVIGAAVRDLGTGFKGFRLSKARAQLAGGALEWALSRRMSRLYDAMPADADHPVTRFLARSGARFARATLLPAYTDVLETMAYGLASTRILGDVAKLAAGQTIPKANAIRLAQARISEDMAARIAAAARTTETRQSGLRLVDTTQWVDKEAAEAFNSAMSHDMKNAVTNPGGGDTPLWTDHWLGRTAFQFKRFIYSTTMRTLIPAMQTHDRRAFQGLTTMVAMGALATALTDMLADGAVDTTRTAAQWVNDSIDKSGALALFYEMTNMAKPTGAPGAAADAYNSLVPEQAQIESPSRFRQRTPVEAIGGPTAGFATDLATVAGEMVQSALGQDDFTQADFHKARRLIPGQNLFWLRNLLNKMEEWVGSDDALDLRQKGERKPKGD